MGNENYQQLEARIAQLEKEVKELKANKNTSEISLDPPIKKVYKPIIIEKETIQERPTAPPRKSELKERTDWETLIGKVWLPRIFIFVLLLGLVWGFRIAVDAGWLNETTRIIIGFIAAGLFYYIGDRQIKENRSALGKVLLVGFVATLMVTTFAMNILYGMIPSSFAFLLNLIWIGIGIYLSHIHRSEAMGVMFAIAGYLIPFLVTGSDSSMNFNMIIAYELIYYITLLWFAVRNQYRILFYVSTLFLHLVYLALYFTAQQIFDNLHALLMTLAILIQHEVLFYTLLKGKIEKLKAFPVLFTSFIVTLLWAKIGFETFEVGYLFALYVLATTIRYGWIAHQAKLKQKGNLFSLSAVLTTLGFSVLIADVVDNMHISLSLYLIQGALAVYIGYTFQSKIQRYLGYFIFYVTTLIIISEPYFYRFEDIVLWIILIGTLYLQVLFSKAFFPINISAAVIVLILFLSGLDYYSVTFAPLYWLGIIGSLYGLYRLAKEQMNRLMKQIYIGINVIIHLAFIAYLTDLFINDSNHEVLLTTAGWSLYAVVCVYLGMKRQLKPLRLLGIGLIFFTLLKLIFFDLVFVSLVTRSILFVFIGLIGIVVSRFIYGKNK